MEAVPGKPSLAPEPRAMAPAPEPQDTAPRSELPLPRATGAEATATSPSAAPQVAQPEFRSAPARPEEPPAPARVERAPAVLAPAVGAAPQAARAGDETPVTFVDPPARVGRIARLVGPVEARLAGGDVFEPARQNLSITSGAAFATGPGGRVALEIGPSRFGLDSGTRLQITALDDETVAAGLEAGVLAAILRPEEQPPRIEIGTARATVGLAVPGRYVIEAGGPGQPTRVTIFDGVARITGPNMDVQLGRGQAAILTGGEGTPVTITAARAGAPPPILAWIDPVTPGARPLPPTARAMTGATELALVGAWDRSPDYGDIWYPPADVGPDWVPFRQGAWVPVGAWGETWVDDRPWAYATSHYGRWVRIGPRWAWAPQPLYREPPPRIPVWAPAVVGFVGPGPGPRFGRPAGWVPLAPFEPYYPPFRASPRYVERVNVVNVRNVTTVTNHWNVVVERPVRDFAPEGPVAERGGLGFRGAALAAAAAGGAAGLAAARYANAPAGTALPEAGLRPRQPVAPLARPLPPALVSAPPGLRDGRATFAGPDGIRGTADDRARPGRIGPDGISDDRARAGRAGPDGIPGTVDDRARVGRAGPDGIPGTADDRARAGRAGPDGIPGTADDRARVGRAGPDGIPGTAEDRGRAGRVGPDGIPGTADDRARAGRAGPDGIVGTADDRARAGRSGPDGIPGTVNDRARVTAPEGPRVGRAGPDGIRGTPDDLARPGRLAPQGPGGARLGPDGLRGTADDVARGGRPPIEGTPRGPMPGAAFTPPAAVPRAELRPPSGFEPRRAPPVADVPRAAPAPRFAPPAYAAPPPRPAPPPIAAAPPPRPVQPPMIARPAGPPPGVVERPRYAPPPAIMAVPPPRPAVAPPPRPFAPPPVAAPPPRAAPPSGPPPQQGERRRHERG
ncbi:DUF6600 domain-containing protein [Muricoccus radiodurans]|uniref:DUF6600 domain-containing protein n=1 Tax=Muricoccus radiodurans TaxID=2231721 RepID=UPI003CF34DD5